MSERATPSTAILPHPDQFIHRHIGPSPDEIADMAKLCGHVSLDALTDVALAAWEDGATWEDALADGWRAITTSPRFLARAVPGAGFFVPKHRRTLKSPPGLPDNTGSQPRLGFACAHRARPAPARSPPLHPRRPMHSLRSLLPALVLAVACLVHAEPLPAERQAKLDARIAEIKTWAADPAVVQAVAAQNASLPADYAAMSQDQWKSLTLLDPFVRSFTRNPAATALKARRAEWVSEAFLNDAKGLKVAFLGKTTNWSHAASAKHLKPLSGAIWQGAVELDESSGQQQVQVSVPVLDGSAPIGSLVVGVSLAKLD